MGKQIHIHVHRTKDAAPSNEAKNLARECETELRSIGQYAKELLREDEVGALEDLLYGLRNKVY